jgi:sucrose-6-phosphate hydrolase SacC (GH32 family)
MMSIPINQIDNAAIRQAMQSVEAAVPRAAQDPTRPLYHFHPPAYWMNDPNGTIYHNGYYHLFYQHNPYGDKWGHMHWGHARSRDMVRWEHLPIALWPSLEMGEEHVYSGCAYINAAGQPMLFYTMVGPGEKGSRPDNEQWAALGDADWISWIKHPENPILSLQTHGGPPFDGEWRDPFIFEVEGRIFLVLGGDYDDIAGVALYEASNPELTEWRYHKLLYQKQKSEIRFFECPNFFPAGNKWVLLTSPYAPVEYAVGDFDLESLTFTPLREGILDPGHGPKDPNYYATNILYAADGRCIQLGWVRGFEPDRGWNGCLALPRVLTIGADQRPRQAPVAELEQLRQGHRAVQNVSLAGGVQQLSNINGDCLEILAHFEIPAGSKAGLHVRSSRADGSGVPITYDGETLRVDDQEIAYQSGSGNLTLHLFLDRSVLELFVDDGALAVTKVIYPPAADQGVALIAEGGAAHLKRLDAWQIASIW